MTNQEKGSKSSLFLIELIIVLFFFLLVAAVCIQVFAKAHALSRSSTELSHAQSQCASVAEVFSGTDGKMETILEYFPEGEVTDGRFVIYYDKEFVPCADEDAVYVLTGEIVDSHRTDMRVLQLSFTGQ